MNLVFQPTLNSVLMIVIGLALVAFGVFVAIGTRGRVFSVGFILAGIANIIFGLTHGFTDMTPIGRMLYKVALIGYIAGVPIIAFYLFRELR